MGKYATYLDREVARIEEQKLDLFPFREDTKHDLGCGFMIPLEGVIGNCLQRSLAL